jgi:type VI protein secretion system component Hcp
MAVDFKTVPFVMAVKIGDNWVETGGEVGELRVYGNVLEGTGLRSETQKQETGEGDPPTTADYYEAESGYFTAVRELKIKARRPYSGTGSNAGPQVSGRVDLADVFVEKYIDRLSPKLFQACCDGTKLPLVVFAAVDSDSSVLTCIQITDSYVSGYDLIGGRWSSADFVGNETTIAQSKTLEQDVIMHGSRKEQVTFWYTAIKIDIWEYTAIMGKDGPEDTAKDILLGWQAVHVADGSWDGGTDAPYVP